MASNPRMPVATFSKVLIGFSVNYAVTPVNQLRHLYIFFMHRQVYSVGLLSTAQSVAGTLAFRGQTVTKVTHIGLFLRM